MDKRLKQATENLQKTEMAINSQTTAPASTEVSPETPPAPQPVLTPTIMEEKKQAEVGKVREVKLSENQEKLREFIKQTQAIYTQNPGTPYQKWFATQPAWSYLARLNEVHVEITSVYHKEDPLDKNAIIVYATGVLVCDYENNLEQGVITKATMCASTSENWLKGKPLSAAYGLAQTRLEERLLRSRFGYQLSLAHIEPTGAEELDVDTIDYGTKDKEI